MSDERKPLYITEKELDMIARTPIFEHLPAWVSLSDWRPYCFHYSSPEPRLRGCDNCIWVEECRG